MRDAMKLAKFYEKLQESDLYGNSKLWATGDFYLDNFDDFKTLLSEYRKERRMGGSTNADRIYERAEIIPLITGGADRGKVNWLPNPINVTGHYFRMGMTSNSSGATDMSIASTENIGGTPIYVHATHVDVNNPDDNDMVWISPYYRVLHMVPASQADGHQGWTGGFFMEDYVERTLPHIFSCVRRIPGYLGAPSALTSPYMIVEPYNWADSHIINRIDWAGPRSWYQKVGAQREALVYGEHLFVNYETNEHNPPWESIESNANGYNAYSDTAIVIEGQRHMGRQPKLSIEDLVERHTLPKVCFLHHGYLEIISEGRVRSPPR